jgi:hypothetical protein
MSHSLALKPVSTSASLKRRELLARAGAGAVVFAVLGGTAVVWRTAQQSVLSPGAGDAYAAWSAQLTGSGGLSMVRAAVLAANAHDSQPWLFDVSNQRIELFADRSRGLGTLDPLLREMELSLGCAIENLVLAARANGFSPSVTLMPSRGDTEHVASIQLTPATAVGSTLFDAIPRRHTDRGPFAARRVEPALLEEMAMLADADDVRLIWLDADPAMSRFGDLTIEATAAIIADPEQSRDDFAWYRQDWDEVQRTRDGITLDAAGLSEPLRIAARILPASNRAALQQGWLDAARTKHVATAAAYGVVLVRDRGDTVQRIRAGRLFQRAHLFATAHALSVQPLNQIFERADRERSAGLSPTFSHAVNAIAPDAWQAVTAFRIGYPTTVTRLAPRRLAEEVIRAA